MARGSGGAPAFATWLAHAGRLIASNQRLIGFPIAIRAVSALLLLPVTLASEPDASFTEFAKQAVQPEKTIVDLLNVPLSTGVEAALTAYLIGAVLVDAWLAGAFIASVRDGQLRWHAGWHAFANLVVLYAIADAIALGIAAYADSHYAEIGVLLAVVLVSEWPLIYADYTIVLERRNALGALARSATLATRRWRETLTLLAAVNVVGALIAGSLGQQLLDAEGVFPPFLAAVLCVDGLIRYASDCAGIALVLEARTPEP